MTTLSKIESLVKEKGMTKEEQIRLIRKERCCLLEEIHEKQQMLDRMDFMLHEIKGIR